VNEPVAAEAPSVAVDRLNVDCLLSTDQAGEGLGGQVDHIARTRLAPAIARALEHAVPGDDTSVWLIRDLAADLALGLDEGSEDELAREWAHEIVSVLVATVAAGPDGDRVVRFPSRTAFLARFAVDVVGGDAWQSWWYASLDGLRSLPSGTAVREAFTSTPSDGAAALALLFEEGSLDRVLYALSEHDADVLLES
jgi:hypothetical protein